MRITAGVLLVLTSLLTTACGSVGGLGKSPKKTCEHARTVIMANLEENAQAALEAAPEDMKAEFGARVKAENAAAREMFVDKCLDLDEASLSCMERIDEVFALEKERSAAIDACPRHDGLTDVACMQKANADRDAKAAPCTQEIISEFLRDLHTTAATGAS